MTTAHDLRQAITRYEAARPAMKRPMRDSATALALVLAGERDALVARLEKRWAWCAGNEGHQHFAERERALLADLGAYEAMEDALRDAASALYGGRAA